MAASRFRRPGSQAYRLHDRARPGRWTDSNTSGLRAGLVLSGIGLFLLGGFVFTAIQNVIGGSDALLLFCGAPFFLFGGLLLVLDVTGLAIQRVRRVTHHCGRCRFYQPLEGQYEHGVCLSDPREGPARRVDSCSYFQYSERAWAHERFAQRIEELKHAAKPG